MKRLTFIVFLLVSVAGFGQTIVDSLKQEVKEQIRAGQYEKALYTLDGNFAVACHDTAGLFEALINLGLFEQDWNTIIKAYKLHKCQPDEDTTDLVMARFFIKHPDEKILLPQAITIPFKPSSSGTPVIKVKINGKTYHFWFDTGAGMTVLSSTTAEACKVKMHKNEAGLAMAASGNIVSLSPAIIDTLEIGNLKVVNHPCTILSQKDLEFRILGIRILKIDGIIGWNLLQQLDVTVNNKTREISLAPAGENKSDKNNFYWFGQPFIACTDSAARVPFTFFLDTGADSPGVYKAYLKRADTSKAKRKTIALGSAGGVKKMNTLIFPLIKLKAGGQQLVLKNVSQDPHNEDTLFECDGVLGINNFKNKAIHFNMKQGFFEISN
ncbi:MAG TPA: retropepsin-like aspartic protease [Bacteroidia bacterium]|jgi:predicted aspartyl protease|nr:retropepsin-like aspartic protease [Bacteroidia bacterium]